MLYLMVTALWWCWLVPLRLTDAALVATKKGWSITPDRWDLQMKDKLSSSPVHTAGDQYEYTMCAWNLCAAVWFFYWMFWFWCDRYQEKEDSWEKTRLTFSSPLRSSALMSASDGFRWSYDFWTPLTEQTSLGPSRLLCLMKTCTSLHLSYVFLKCWYSHIVNKLCFIIS